MVFYILKNKCVILQSTFHQNKQINRENENKHNIILDYNQTKGDVDTVDKIIASYTCKRETQRCPIVVFANILMYQ